MEEVDVINESVIRVAASVNIPDDGPEISAISLEDYSVNDRPKPMIPKLPKEFTIDQTRFTIDPEAHVTLKVTLCSIFISQSCFINKSKGKIGRWVRLLKV